MTARRVDVEIGTLVVDDVALTGPREVASAVERELKRLAAQGTLQATAGRPTRELSVKLGNNASARSVGAAIAHAVGKELIR